MDQLEIIEKWAWWFVSKEWPKIQRKPKPDQGFEEEFKNYLFNKEIIDTINNFHDLSLGAFSLKSFSNVNHELDVVATKNSDLLVFELKNYAHGGLNKEIVLVFWGKFIDFYFRNYLILKDYNINLFIVLASSQIDENIRDLCSAFGIKLIEPEYMTINVLSYFTNNLFSKIDNDNILLLSKVENLLNQINEIKNFQNYNFSDIFVYHDNKIRINTELLDSFEPKITVGKLKILKELLYEYKNEAISQI
ncbi:MAG: hypothetical protein IAE93_13895 [Ignavibacteria bacterium]|nr:hypothetical protein [Ignavibacteria bacterium]